MKNLQSLIHFFLLFIFCWSCSSTKNVDSFPVKSDSGVLYGHTWELEYMSGVGTDFDELFPDKKPHITFDDSNKVVKGNSGCNGYSAPYTKEADKISFGEPGPATEMYCGEGEPQFLLTMKKINRYSVDSDGKLNLIIDEIPMMRFHKQ